MTVVRGHSPPYPPTDHDHGGRAGGPTVVHVVGAWSDHGDHATAVARATRAPRRAQHWPTLATAPRTIRPETGERALTLTVGRPGPSTRPRASSTDERPDPSERGVTGGRHSGRSGLLAYFLTVLLAVN